MPAVYARRPYRGVLGDDILVVERAIGGGVVVEAPLGHVRPPPRELLLPVGPAEGVEALRVHVLGLRPAREVREAARQRQQALPLLPHGGDPGHGEDAETLRRTVVTVRGKSGSEVSETQHCDGTQH